MYYVTVTQGASPAVTLTHDGNGNLTGEGTWAFAYDAENRLRTATRAGTAATYLYGPAGRRQAKVVNSVVTSFLSEGAEEIAEYTGAGALLRRYVPGPGTDQPIAMITPVGAGQTRSYFHVNRQGSTVAMSNDAGVMAEGPYTYDAYGQGPTSAGVPFKYTGRRLDPETGLYYYRARYYSASLGRFLQTDPIGYGDDMNMYAYVGGDPVNATDPSGEESVCDSSGSNCVDKVVVIGERSPIRKQQAEQREISDRASNVMAAGAIAMVGTAATRASPYGRALSVAGSLALGAAIVLSNREDDADARASIHGSSYRYFARETEVYHIVDNATGETIKIGMTIHGEQRYTKEYYRQRNARYVGIGRYQLRPVAAAVEFTELFMYYSAHGRLPKENRVFR